MLLLLGSTAPATAVPRPFIRSNSACRQEYQHKNDELVVSHLYSGDGVMCTAAAVETVLRVTPVAAV